MTAPAGWPDAATIPVLRERLEAYAAPLSQWRTGATLLAMIQGARNVLLMVERPDNPLEPKDMRQVRADWLHQTLSTMQVSTAPAEVAE